MIAETCERLGCSLRFAEGVQVTGASLQGQTFDFEGQSYGIRMIGAMQPVNAALAILATRALGLPRDAIEQGLKDALVPCRTQYIPGEPELLLDGAHNAPAIDMLLQTLDKYFAGREVTLLFACMRNKDYAGMAQCLGPRCRKAFVTNVDPNRGMDTATLQSLFATYTDCIAEGGAERAFELARAHARERGALLLVCGSLYLAGRVWGELRDNLQ
jgi:dihydrofolate synthase/folylpolyglutamate synthase